MQHTFCTLLIFAVTATLLEHYLLSRTKTNDEEFIFLFLDLKIFLTNLTAGELTFMLQSERVGRVIALKFQMLKWRFRFHRRRGIFNFPLLSIHLLIYRGTPLPASVDEKKRFSWSAVIRVPSSLTSGNAEYIALESAALAIKNKYAWLWTRGIILGEPVVPDVTASLFVFSFVNTASSPLAILSC